MGGGVIENLFVILSPSIQDFALSGTLTRAIVVILRFAGLFVKKNLKKSRNCLLQAQDVLRAPY